MYCSETSGYKQMLFFAWLCQTHLVQVALSNCLFFINWLEIKSLNSHICNLSACHIICCIIVIFLFHVLGCQRVVSKVKQPSVAQVCLWKSWKFTYACQNMYLSAQKFWENYNTILANGSWCSEQTLTIYYYYI